MYITGFIIIIIQSSIGMDSSC